MFLKSSTNIATTTLALALLIAVNGAPCFSQSQKLSPEAQTQVLKCMLTGKYGEAVKVLDAEIKLHPNCGAAYNWRAEAQIQLGADFLDKALADANQAVRLDPKESGAYETRAMIYAQVGKLELAIKDADKAVELKPDDLRALDFRANTHALNGNLKAALADLNKVVTANSQYIAAHSDRSFVYSLMGKYDKALADANQAINLINTAKFFNKIDNNAYGNRARAYVGLGKYSAALPDAGEVVKQFPKNCRGYDLRAEIYKKLGKSDLAKQDEEKATELRRDPKRLWIEKQSYADIKKRIKP